MRKLWGGVYFIGRGRQEFAADTSDPAAIHQKLLLSKRVANCRGDSDGFHPSDISHMSVCIFASKPDILIFERDFLLAS